MSLLKVVRTDLQDGVRIGGFGAGRRGRVEVHTFGSRTAPKTTAVRVAGGVGGEPAVVGAFRDGLVGGGYGQGARHQRYE